MSADIASGAEAKEPTNEALNEQAADSVEIAVPVGAWAGRSVVNGANDRIGSVTGGCRSDSSGGDAGNSAGAGVSDGAGSRAGGSASNGVADGAAEGAGRDTADTAGDHASDGARRYGSDVAW